MVEPRFNWRVLQDGQLPLRPDKQVDLSAEHRCTTLLVWPVDAPPSAANTVVVDPCFTSAGSQVAQAQLAGLNVSFEILRRTFVTHPHHDHLPHLPREMPPIQFQEILFGPEMPPGMKLVHCPGHDFPLMALVFTAADGLPVWVVGDAILDEEWLRAWGYYWPNGYTPDAVAETWRSVARIVSGAAIIVPGHGPAFAVTADLVRHLLETFPSAAYANLCPSVESQLQARLESL
ncbi:MAG: hypothetical protein HY866_07470 [Chloroflexi bacterium]|nr:hypothetical protein [Chloroflexota bacterium]